MNLIRFLATFLVLCFAAWLGGYDFNTRAPYVGGFFILFIFISCTITIVLENWDSSDLDHDL